MTESQSPPVGWLEARAPARPAGPTPRRTAGPTASFRQVLARVPRWTPPPTTPVDRQNVAAPRVPVDSAGLVAEAAERYGVDPALIAGVIEAESGFDPNAVSPAGATGLMQLMDATARGLGVTDRLDPRQNVLGGTKLLGQLLARYGGDVRLALAAYNAGPGAVDRYGGIPPYAETQRYVPRVLAAAAKYRQRTER